jgi:hypothetical protein
MIQSTVLDDVAPIEGLMLAEDIQLGICSLQSRIWHLSMRSDTPDFNSAIELGHLRRRLESWKLLLTRIPISESDASRFSAEQHWATRYYYGMEDHSKAGWQNIVYCRQKTLVYDGTVLYHLSSLHLYFNARILSQLAKDLMTNNSNEAYGNMYQQAHQRRITFAREWVKKANSRRALCHAAAILASFNGLPVPLRRAIDPIIYVAFSVGALVVWAYGSFASHHCEACTPGIRTRSAFSDLPEVELTRWSQIETEPTLQKEKEAWIEVGGGLVTLIGMKVCRCNLNSLILRYYSCIPEGWNVAHTIAPGIFKGLDARMEV